MLISWSDKSYYKSWRSINTQQLLLPSAEKETDNNSQQNDSHCYRHNNYRNLALVAGCSYCWDEKQKMEIKVKMIYSTHMSLSSEGGCQWGFKSYQFVSSFTVWVFPLCCLFLVWKGNGWKETKNTCKTKPKPQQNCISSLNSENKVLQNAAFEFANYVSWVPLCITGLAALEITEIKDENPTGSHLQREHLQNVIVKRHKQDLRDKPVLQEAINN